jgi:hypothetical protein
VGLSCRTNAPLAHGNCYEGKFGGLHVDCGYEGPGSLLQWNGDGAGDEGGFGNVVWAGERVELELMRVPESGNRAGGIKVGMEAELVSI